MAADSEKPSDASREWRSPNVMASVASFKFCVKSSQEQEQAGQRTEVDDVGRVNHPYDEIIQAGRKPQVNHDRTEITGDDLTDLGQNVEKPHDAGSENRSHHLITGQRGSEDPHRKGNHTVEGDSEVSGVKRTDIRSPEHEKEHNIVPGQSKHEQQKDRASQGNRVLIRNGATA